MSFSAPALLLPHVPVTHERRASGSPSCAKRQKVQPRCHNYPGVRSRC